MALLWTLPSAAHIIIPSLGMETKQLAAPLTCQKLTEVVACVTCANETLQGQAEGLIASMQTVCAGAGASGNGTEGGNGTTAQGNGTDISGESAGEATSDGGVAPAATGGAAGTAPAVSGGAAGASGASAAGSAGASTSYVSTVLGLPLIPAHQQTALRAPLAPRPPSSLLRASRPSSSPPTPRYCTSESMLHPLLAWARINFAANPTTPAREYRVTLARARPSTSCGSLYAPRGQRRCSWAAQSQYRPRRPARSGPSRGRCAARAARRRA